jgi:hypothetical protein
MQLGVAKDQKETSTTPQLSKMAEKKSTLLKQLCTTSTLKCSPPNTLHVQYENAIKDRSAMSRSRPPQTSPPCTCKPEELTELSHLNFCCLTISTTKCSTLRTRANHYVNCRIPARALFIRASRQAQYRFDGLDSSLTHAQI